MLPISLTVRPAQEYFAQTGDFARSLVHAGTTRGEGCCVLVMVGPLVRTHAATDHRVPIGRLITALVHPPPPRHGPARPGHLSRHRADRGGPDQPGHDGERRTRAMTQRARPAA